VAFADEALPDGSPEPTGSPDPTAAAAATPIEVTVQGDRPPPSASSIDRTESRLVPGSFGDPFRAIESLPGVTPTASGAPYVYVRGAPPGDVGYVIDGIPIPLIYHVLLGPSVFCPALIDRIDFYPGAYPARFGRFAGGIVSAETREPEGRAHGEAALRLFDAGAVAEAPFASGRGTALIAARHSYTGPLLSLFAPDLHLGYGDYQARLGYDVAPGDRVSVLAFGAHDVLTQDEPFPGEAVDTLFDATFHRIDVRHDHRIGEQTFVREAITLGMDELEADDAYFVDSQVRVRIELRHRSDDGATVRAGADLRMDAFAVEQWFTGDRSFSERASRRDMTAGAYLEVSFFPTPDVELMPGIRADVFDVGATSARDAYGTPDAVVTMRDTGRSELAIDPRLAARITITDAIHIVHALGLAHQPPSFGLPGPQLTTQGLDGGLQTSVQTSSGVELDMPADIAASITLFQNAFFGLTEPLDITSKEGLSAHARRDGRSAGVEVSIRRRLTRRIGGLISYTLSRSWREGGAASAFDRTHVASAALSVDLGRGWRAGTRLVYYSGAPRPAPRSWTGPIGGLASSSAPATSDGRLSPFFRADVRLEKRWRLGPTGWLAIVAEVLNATLTREEVVFHCADPGGCEVRTIGPVTLPSLGLEAGF
jgi:hypothetical protein